jgi:hypothetical protein
VLHNKVQLFNLRQKRKYYQNYEFVHEIGSEGDESISEAGERWRQFLVEEAWSNRQMWD